MKPLVSFTISWADAVKIVKKFKQKKHQVGYSFELEPWELGPGRFRQPLYQAAFYKNYRDLSDLYILRIYYTPLVSK